MNPKRLGVAVLAVAAAACADVERTDAGLPVRDSAGVTIISNPVMARDSVTLAAPAARIGSFEVNADPAYEFASITDIALIRDDRLVIVDNGSVRVGVYRTSGEWLVDLGRSGQGPGEYRAPLWVSTVGDTAFIWDATLRRLTQFSSVSGEYLGSNDIPDRSGSHRLVVTPAGIVDEVEWGQGPSPESAAAAVLRRQRSGTIADTIVGPYAVPKIGWRIVDERTQQGIRVNPPALAARSPWAVSGDDVLWVPPAGSRIEVRRIDSANLVGITELPYRIGPPEPAHEDAYLQAVADRFGFTPEQRRGVRAETTFAETRPAITALIADEESRVWVAIHEPANPFGGYVGSTWDVLDANGRATRHVRFPSNFRLMAVRNDIAYGVETSENGVMVVAAFRTARPDTP